MGAPGLLRLTASGLLDVAESLAHGGIGDIDAIVAEYLRDLCQGPAPSLERRDRIVEMRDGIRLRQARFLRWISEAGESPRNLVDNVFADPRILWLRHAAPDHLFLLHPTLTRPHDPCV